MTIRTKLLLAAAAVVLAAIIGVAMWWYTADSTAAAPALTATQEPSPTPAPTPSPTPSLTPSPTPVPTPFTLAWITDTQTLTMYESIAAAIVPMFRWVEQTREEYNTVALVHTGDLVENGWNQKYWDRINLGIEEIGMDLPFIPTAGNHDVAKTEKSYEPWFEQPFMERLAPERCYRGGEGYYELIEAGGESIVIVALGYLSCDAEGMAWARDVFDAHKDSIGILAVHSYLSKSPHTSAIWTDQGGDLREHVVIPCENVRFVLCGHVHGTARHDESFDDDGDGKEDRLVIALRHNEQDRRYRDRVGWLRMLIFDPLARTLEVQTYSPFLDKHYTAESRAAGENFVIENAF